ncbi:MAB_1171c family putative transporter [Kitasatospora sp. NPDC059408]|uniref:MAB_1171c family putative transporter n=1 Tax=Kitasatospora sp. NPDC059408 TaxID=3346823 RepID=UPI0036948F29
MLLLTVVYAVLAVITWTAFFYKVRDLVRDWRNRELQILCLSIATFAAPFVLASPHVYMGIDRLLGVPNIATLIIYVCVAVCVSGFIALLVSWSSAQSGMRVRHWLGVGYSLTTIAAMAVLFFLGNVDGVEHPVDFDVTFADVPYISVFLLGYQLLFTTSMVMLIVLCRRYAAAVDRPWLRRGLRTVALGAFFGLGYGVPKILNMLWDQVATSPLHTVSSIGAPLSASVSALLFSVGFTMPAWGEGLDRLREIAVSYRAYKRLYPLWHDLATAFPELVLLPSNDRRQPWSAKALLARPAIGIRQGRMTLSPRGGRQGDDQQADGLQDLDLLVARQRVEIRDAQLRLRPYYTDTAANAARDLARERDLAPDEVEAAVEAAQVSVALRTHAAGAPVPPPAPGRHEPAAVDPAEEVAFLVKVAVAYRTSPIVAAVTERFGTAGSFDAGVTAS